MKVAVDRTKTGKPHFEVLDGLRGIAALFVVIFHIFGITTDWVPSKNPLHHAYLAVDFFFALSGFVIGYAYDDRWGRMTLKRFFLIRVVRLHPLLILGTLIGFASYVLDPFAGKLQQASWHAILAALALALLALPEKPLPNRWTDTHTLNGVEWTLFQEYIGNIAYALVLRRLSSRALGILVLVSAAVLVVSTGMRGVADGGSDYDSFWMAPIRLVCPFVTGLWLYRVRGHLPRIRWGLLPLTIVLAAVFMMPVLPRGNGVYDGLAVVLVFPLVLILGAHSEAGVGMVALCKFSGRLSYPLYITHYPFMYVYENYVLVRHPASATVRIVQAALLAWVLLFAWLAGKIWDQPIRAWLRQRLGLSDK